MPSMESTNPVIRRAEAQYSQDGPGFASINTPGAQSAPGSPPPAGPAQPSPAGMPSQGFNAGNAGVSAANAKNLQDMYNQPSVAGGSGAAMTLNDVIVKTGINFAILLVGALIGWNTASTMPYIFFGAAVLGMVLGLVNAFKKTVSPPLIMVYAFVQGVFLGGISFAYQEFAKDLNAEYGNLVQTAVIATFVVFAVMLGLYKSRIIKVNNKFKKIMMVSMISYLAFAVISLVAGLFGVGDGFGFFGIGAVGIIFSVLAVVLASFTLCLDFDAIEQGIRYGVPERESWRMAFGLMVTLIWLYLEILRLLALVAASRD